MCSWKLEAHDVWYQRFEGASGFIFIQRCGKNEKPIHSAFASNLTDVIEFHEFRESLSERFFMRKRELSNTRKSFKKSNPKTKSHSWFCLLISMDHRLFLSIGFYRKPRCVPRPPVLFSTACFFRNICLCFFRFFLSIGCNFPYRQAWMNGPFICCWYYLCIIFCPTHKFDFPSIFSCALHSSWQFFSIRFNSFGFSILNCSLNRLRFWAPCGPQYRNHSCTTIWADPQKIIRLP